jgi:hypothetical protein
MINREEAARLREEFWTTFGRYMAPVPSSEGLKINWINYRTSFKDIRFRMDADHQAAVISISLEHRDEEVRELYFQQFEECKTMLGAILGEEWIWQRNVTLPEQRTMSRIYKELHGFTVFNKAHWPELISFFKPRMIALDRFWENARYSFEALR